MIFINTPFVGSDDSKSLYGSFFLLESKSDLDFMHLFCTGTGFTGWPSVE